MLKKIEGIVLKTTKYGETSLISHIFTYQYGLRSFIANSVRNTKNASINGLVPMSIVDIDCYFQDAKNILRIKNATMNYPLLNVFENVIKSCIGLFLAEVTKKVLVENQANEELYQTLKSILIDLNDTEVINPNINNNFLIQLADILGFGIYIENGMIDNTKTLVFDIASGHFLTNYHGIESFKYIGVDATRLLIELLNFPNSTSNRSQRVELYNGLIRYFQYHIDNFGELKSSKIIQQVFH